MCMCMCISSPIKKRMHLRRERENQSGCYCLANIEATSHIKVVGEEFKMLILMQRVSRYFSGTICILHFCIYSEQFSLDGRHAVDNVDESSRIIFRKPWNTLNGKPTLLFAHRGERVLPANTLAAYDLAAIEGADYLELDLYLTKDNVFVCYHDLFLKAETDVESHPEFEHLRRKQIAMGDRVQGFRTSTNDWVIKDFTYAELKKLRVRQDEVGIRPQYFNFIFGIPTFQEFLDLAHKMTVKLHRKIGIAPELKFPELHNKYKSPHFMENRFVKIMHANGYGSIASLKEDCIAKVNETATVKIACPPVIVQSFHHDTIKYLRNKVKYELLLLLGTNLKDYTFSGLKQVSTYANYIGVFKDVLLDPNIVNLMPNLPTTTVNLIRTTNLVSVAHSMGLKVSVFTLPDSREYSTTTGIKCEETAGISACPLLTRSKESEMNYFFKLGVDGLFIENIGESLLIRVKYETKC